MATRFIPTSRLEYYDIVNKKGEDLGQVQNFMVDMETGRIALVIVSFGGILGFTDKWLALPFERLIWKPRIKKFMLNVPRKALEQAKGINKDTWPNRVSARWIERVFADFGCAPYWIGSLGKLFNSGEKAEKSGVYEFVSHVDSRSCKPDCKPTKEEREVPLSKGETFPPLKSCGKAARWRLVRAA